MIPSSHKQVARKIKKKIQEKKELWRHLIWTEGKYIDFWSIPHILIGFVIGVLLIDLLKLSFLISLFAVTIIKIGWEIWEDKYLIKEQFTNKIFDVICGIIGFLIFYFLNDPNALNLGMLIITSSSWLILASWGYVSMHKLSSNQKKLR